MTTGLEDSQFYLIDNWPGKPTDGPNPSDWTAFSAKEDFPLGTKRLVYDETHHGWATLMFLKFVKGTAGYPGVRKLCGIDTVASNADGSYYNVCNDGGEVDLMGPIAVALGTPDATLVYGWFWVGGVAPVDTVPALASGMFDSDDSALAERYMVLVDSASICKFHLSTATDIGMCSAFSTSADA